MSKLFSKCLILASIILVFNSVVFANGPATIYKVRVAKFELFNGTNWITVFEGTSSKLDIASVASGTAAGSFLTGLNVPDGTYTMCRVTPSPTFSFKGNDGANYTTAVAGAFGGSVPGTAAQVAEFSFTLTGANVPGPDTQDFSATPITIKDGVANHKVRVNFDVSNAVQYVAGPNEVYPAAPVVTMSVQ